MGQQPNKYHISDDGKILRINEDGSFTEVTITKPHTKDFKIPNKIKHPIWHSIVFWLMLIIAMGCLIFSSYMAIWYSDVWDVVRRGIYDETFFIRDWSVQLISIVQCLCVACLTLIIALIVKKR